MKQILLYNLNNEKGKQIRKVCSPLRIVCKDVMPNQYMEQIGALAGLPGFGMKQTPVAAPGFNEEMMIFCHFSNDDIYAFLSHYKAAGIAPIALKAALTPHNMQWNSLKIHKELSEEHRQMNK